MAKKFVINNDALIIDNVGYHFQLVKRGDVVKGGGYWHLIKNRTRYTFTAVVQTMDVVTKRIFRRS